MTKARVANLKNQLRAKGYPVTIWKRVGLKPWTGWSVRPSKPVAARSYCRCGLTLPCNSCLHRTGWEQPYNQDMTTNVRTTFRNGTGLGLANGVA